MSKTIEEMRAAVIEYCEEVCPDFATTLTIFDGDRPLRLSRSNRRYGADGIPQNIGITQIGDVWIEGFEINLFGMCVVLNGKSSDQEIQLAYTLLGPSERDAIEAERKSCTMHSNALDECWRVSRTIADKWKARSWKLLGIAREKESEAFARFIRNEKLESDLQAERARSAKLVELCPKAFHKAYKQAQRHASENRSYNPNDLYKEWVSELQPEYLKALEAYKKGGVETKKPRALTASQQSRIAQVRLAYGRIRTIDQTIADDILDLMKNAAIAAIESEVSND